MKRGGPLRSDPAKIRAWQQRGAKKYADRQRDNAGNNIQANVTPQKQSRIAQRKRRNDSGWREDVLARVGRWCRSCGQTGQVEIDHVWPRSQGGPSHVLNGLPLCGPFGCDAHGKKTRSEIVIEWHWLDAEQRAWLADVGWVSWDDDGQPHGRGWRHFGPRKSRRP